MDPVTLLVGAAIAAAGYLAGHATRRDPPLPPVEVKPICSCDDPKSMHENGVGRCSYVHEPGTGYAHQCPCQVYIGPEPFEILYPTPLLPPEDR